jgi:hypothetical protein
MVKFVHSAALISGDVLYLSLTNDESESVDLVSQLDEASAAATSSSSFTTLARDKQMGMLFTETNHC